MDTMILHTMNSFHSYGLGCHNQLGYAYLIRYIEIMRQAYGYRDDEYFFLKLFDSSRHSQRGNLKSHRICD